MADEIKILETITKTTDMGRDSLNNILNHSNYGKLNGALQKQLTQYDQTYKTAEQLLRAKGKSPQKTGTPVKIYSNAVSDIKTMTAENAASKIAEMVIQGSTMGLTEMTKQLHAYHGNDQTVRGLAQNYIQTEQSNIEEIKQFL